MDSPIDRVQVGAYVDVFYGFNPEFPEDRVSFPAGFGPTGKRANEFGLNLGAIELQVEPEPVGLHLIFSGGTFADVIHASELEGPGAGPDVWRYVQQASVSWEVSEPMLLEAGIMPSHIGYESVFTFNNINYTHAWVSDLTPYYQTGVRAQYQISDEWMAQLLLLNGWQVIGDNNDGKSFGGHLGWASGPASISLNGWAGPETPSDDDHWRFLAEVVATLQATSWLAVAAQGDFGWQQAPGDETNDWQNGAIWVRLGPEAYWLGLRGEYVHDLEGAISTAKQNVREVTATVAYEVAEPLLVKLEARYDRSSQPVFPAEVSGTLRKEQLIGIAGAVASF